MLSGARTPSPPSHPGSCQDISHVATGLLDSDVIILWDYRVGPLLSREE